MEHMLASSRLSLSPHFLDCLYAGLSQLLSSLGHGRLFGIVSPVDRGNPSTERSRGSRRGDGRDRSFGTGLNFLILPGH